MEQQRVSLTRVALMVVGLLASIPATVMFGFFGFGLSVLLVLLAALAK